jgi:hypothetical protein
MPGGRSLIVYDDGEVEEIRPHEEPMLACGQLVWAKMKGFPWWPARSWTHVGKVDHHVIETSIVEFLGEDHTAPLSSVETVPFKANFDKHIAALLHPDGVKRGAHKHAPAAVQEALEALELPLFLGEGKLADSAASEAIRAAPEEQHSPEVAAKLMASYTQCSRPNDSQLAALEEATGLHRKQVVSWFLHRRNEGSAKGKGKRAREPTTPNQGTTAKRPRTSPKTFIDCAR